MKLFSKTLLMAFAFSAVSGLAVAAGDKAASESSGASGSSGAAAESGSAAGASGSTSFSSVDKDGNGYVDANEAAGISGLDMKAADTDADGRLSRTEFEAAVQGGASSGGSSSSPGSSSPGGSSSGGATSPSESGSSGGTR